VSEPVFGTSKSVLGFWQFLLCGLDRVRGKWPPDDHGSRGGAQEYLYGAYMSRCGAHIENAGCTAYLLASSNGCASDGERAGVMAANTGISVC
jgi:hypothetical protein